MAWWLPSLGLLVVVLLDFDGDKSKSSSSSDELLKAITEFLVLLEEEALSIISCFRASPRFSTWAWGLFTDAGVIDAGGGSEKAWGTYTWGTGGISPSVFLSSLGLESRDWAVTNEFGFVSSPICFSPPVDLTTRLASTILDFFAGHESSFWLEFER